MNFFLLENIFRTKLYLSSPVKILNKGLSGYSIGIRGDKVLINIIETYFRFRIVSNFTEQSNFYYRALVGFVFVSFYKTAIFSKFSSKYINEPIQSLYYYYNLFSTLIYKPGILSNYLFVAYKLVKVSNPKILFTAFPQIIFGLIGNKDFTNFSREINRLNLPSISFGDLSHQGSELLTYYLPANFSYGTASLLSNVVFYALKSSIFKRVFFFNSNIKQFLIKICNKNKINLNNKKNINFIFVTLFNYFYLYYSYFFFLDKFFFNLLFDYNIFYNLYNFLTTKTFFLKFNYYTYFSKKINYILRSNLRIFLIKDLNKHYLFKNLKFFLNFTLNLNVYNNLLYLFFFYKNILLK